MKQKQKLSQIESFLNEAVKHKKYSIHEIAGDASSRKYYRILFDDGNTAILMDDDTFNPKIEAFLKIDSLLLNAGVRVPQIYAQDLKHNFLLLEDLGNADLASYVGTKQEKEMLLSAVDILLQIYKNVQRPHDIKSMDEEFILKDFSLFLDWYMPCVLNQDLSEEIRHEFFSLIAEYLPLLKSVPSSLVIWDYHANNVLVQGKTCGVIDFQDALWGPFLYDLVSLIEDERRFISRELRLELKDYFYSNLEGIKRDDFEKAYAFMALLRHMRVIGRFTTLITVSDKPHYAQYVSRAWELLSETLNYPLFSKLKAWLNAVLPVEKRIAPQKPKITEAFVLAAGRGTRMLHLTQSMPKPLVKVGDKSLIDYNFDKLREVGIRNVVVNLCYKGDMIFEHLQQYQDFEIIFSREKEALETGGGIKKALSYLKNDAFFVMNSDTFWIDLNFKPAMRRMMDAWDSNKYDILLLLHPMKDILGDNNQGIGNYRCDENGLLCRNEKKEQGYPYWFTGVSIVHSRVFENSPKGKFSLRDLFDIAQKNKRLGFVLNKGILFHVGTPEALLDAEKWLKKNITVNKLS